MTSYFSLPREIRDQVYLYLVRDHVNSAEFSSKYHTSTFQLQFHPAIFQVNRQIHREASQTLYGLNCIAIRVDPHSPCVSGKLETLARLSIRPWVRRFDIKISFFDESAAHRLGDDEGWRAPKDVMLRMRVRLRILVQALSSMNGIDSLRIDWFAPDPKALSLDQQLVLLRLFDPLCGRVRKAKVEVHVSRTDVEDDWKEYDKQLELMGRALESKKEIWPDEQPYQNYHVLSDVPQTR